MDKRDYIQFGDLKVPVMGGLYAFSGERGYDFVEYQLASGKNIIEPAGETLRTHSLSIMLRAYLGDDINGTIETLDKMMESGEAYDLIFINGLYKGKYVITNIRDRIDRTLPTGNLLEYDTSLEIKQSVARVVLTETVQSNTKYKPTKGTISQREKTKKMNSKMPVNTKLKK